MHVILQTTFKLCAFACASVREVSLHVKTPVNTKSEVRSGEKHAHVQVIMTVCTRASTCILFICLLFFAYLSTEVLIFRSAI